MRNKSLMFSIFFLIAICGVQAQNKSLEGGQSIISRTASIKKYYDQNELKELNKGQLIELYSERIQVLIKTLPFIGLATSPGVTMADIGIPQDAQNKKDFDSQNDAINAFLANMVSFQTKMMPYSDKSNLISAVLFYEGILKSWHELDRSGH